MNQIISQAINIVRFPLACLIVYSHYYTPDISADIVINGGAWYAFIGEFSNHMPMVMVVPLFFFMSGYLYFANTDKGFNIQIWKKKSINRVKSLILPYIAWNLLILALFALVQAFTGNSETMQKEGYKLVADYQLIDYLKAIWAIDSTGFPMDGPLWFVRDLIVTSILLAYPIYYLMKKTGVFGLIALFIVMHCGLEIPIPGLSISCIFYFSWGALCAIKNFDLFTNVSKRTSQFFGLAILGSLLVYILCCVFNSPVTAYCRTLYICATIALVFGWLAPYIKEGKIKAVPFLANASFFIYALHKPVQVIFRRYSFAIFHPSSELELSLMVIFIPLIVILICLAAFYVIKHYVPFMKILTGFR